MLRMAYSNTVARSNRLPSSRRRSGMVRKTSSSDAGMGQPPIRVVAYRFRHFRPRESPDRTSKLREMNSPGGLLQLLGMSLPPCCRFHPAEVKEPLRSDFGSSCCLHPPVVGSAFGATHFRGHIRVYFHYGPAARRLVVSPRETLSIGFTVLVSRHPAIQTTGLLTFAPAGLSPAEHASLHWT